jgi:hypothetical protein
MSVKDLDQKYYELSLAELLKSREENNKLSNQIDAAIQALQTPKTSTHNVMHNIPITVFDNMIDEIHAQGIYINQTLQRITSPFKDEYLNI